MSSNSSTTTAQTVDRDLPDDQFKIEDETEYGEAELQTMERAMDLSNQFEEIKYRTTEDGMVLGKLKNIETSANNDRIVVEIDLPAEGDTERKRFRKPKRWDNNYNFVRWIRYYEYSAETFPQMIDDECKVKVSKPSDGSDYKLFVPEKEKSWRDRIPDPSISPIYTTYKESGVPFFLGIGSVLFAITTLFTISGTIHLMPTRIEEAAVLLSLAFVFILIIATEAAIQKEHR